MKIPQGRSAQIKKLKKQTCFKINVFTEEFICPGTLLNNFDSQRALLRNAHYIMGKKTEREKLMN